MRLRIVLSSIFVLSGLSWAYLQPYFASSRREPFTEERIYDHVPILLFHNLDGSGQYSVTRKDFRDQLEEIRRRGLSVISLSELVERSRTNTSLTEPSIVITIDDDYENIGRVAAPLLRQYGYPATLFVYIKDINNYPSGGLSWDDLRRLHREGFEIQNHSWTHGVFHKPKGGESFGDYEARVTKEISLSRQVLEKKIPGNRIYAFAFPMGYRSPYLESRCRDEGYDIMLTTDAVPVDLRAPFTGIFHRFTLEHNQNPVNRILYHRQLDLAAIPRSPVSPERSPSETAGEFHPVSP